jgi:predicted alpha/beta superfamily hydrolase
MSTTSVVPNSPVRTPRSALIDFTSSINGRTYRLLISQPFADPPPGGYPVLWSFDAQGYHGFVTDMTRNRALAQEMVPVLVVALGYPEDEPTVWLSRRVLDLTPTVPAADPAATTYVAAGGGAGGLEDCLDMLQGEALPKVEALFVIDRGSMALWGHSLGGLAVLHSLFTRPTLFESYLAISPSIWWDGRVVLKGEEAFVEQVRSGSIAPRVLIAVGGSEDTAPTRLPRGYPGSLDELVERSKATWIGGNARALFERLEGLPVINGFAVRFACPADETHLTTPFATLRMALDLAFPPEALSR